MAFSYSNAYKNPANLAFKSPQNNLFPTHEPAFDLSFIVMNDDALNNYKVIKTDIHCVTPNECNTKMNNFFIDNAKRTIPQFNKMPNGGFHCSRFNDANDCLNSYKKHVIFDELYGMHHSDVSGNDAKMTALNKMHNIDVNDMPLNREAGAWFSRELSYQFVKPTIDCHAKNRTDCDNVLRRAGISGVVLTDETDMDKINCTNEPSSYDCLRKLRDVMGVNSGVDEMNRETTITQNHLLRTTANLSVGIVVLLALTGVFSRG